MAATVLSPPPIVVRQELYGVPLRDFGLPDPAGGGAAWTRQGLYQAIDAFIAHTTKHSVVLPDGVDISDYSTIKDYTGSTRTTIVVDGTHKTFIAGPTTRLYNTDEHNPCFTYVAPFRWVQGVSATPISTAINSTDTLDDVADTPVNQKLLKVLLSSGQTWAQGDVFKLISDDRCPEIATQTTQARLGEFLTAVMASTKTSASSGTALYASKTNFDEVFPGATYSTNIRLCALSACGFTWIGGSGDYDDNRSNKAYGADYFRLINLIDPLVKEFRADRMNTRCISMVGCYGYEVRSCRFNNGLSQQVNPQFSYGVADISSDHGRVVDCNGNNMRHIFTTVDGFIATNRTLHEEIGQYGRSRFFDIQGGTGSNLKAQAWDAHECAFRGTYRGVKAVGGFAGGSSAGPAISSRGNYHSHVNAESWNCREGENLPGIGNRTVAARHQGCTFQAFSHGGTSLSDTPTPSSTIMENCEYEVDPQGNTCGNFNSASESRTTNSSGYTPGSSTVVPLTAALKGVGATYATWTNGGVTYTKKIGATAQGDTSITFPNASDTTNLPVSTAISIQHLHTETIKGRNVLRFNGSGNVAKGLTINGPVYVRGQGELVFDFTDLTGGTALVPIYANGDYIMGWEPTVKIVVQLGANTMARLIDSSNAACATTAFDIRYEISSGKIATTAPDVTNRTYANPTGIDRTKFTFPNCKSQGVSVTSWGTRDSRAPQGVMGMIGYVSGKKRKPYPELTGSTTGIMSTGGAINTMYAHPIKIETPDKIDNLYSTVTVGQTGAQGSGALYGNLATDTAPGELLSNSAAVAATSNNVDITYALGTALYCEPGWYWGVSNWTWSGTAPTVAIISQTGAGPIVTTTALGIAGASSTVVTGKKVASTFGTWPSPFGAASEQLGVPLPYVFPRTA